MAFKYGDFIIERDDKHNVSLYRMESTEIKENAGRGKGRGTPTGQYEMKKIHKGFFGKMSGALQLMVNLLLEEGQDVSELESILKQVSEVTSKIKTMSAEEVEDLLKAESDGEKANGESEE